MREALDFIELADWDCDVDVFGNIARRRVRSKFPGAVLPGHEHNYAHATALVKGSIRLTFEYRDKRVTVRTLCAPDMFEVPADVKHTIKALEPGTECWCIFAVRDEDGHVVEKVEMKHLRDRRWHERKD